MWATDHGRIESDLKFHQRGSVHPVMFQLEGATFRESRVFSLRVNVPSIVLYLFTIYEFNESILCEHMMARDARSYFEANQ
jgi:hypothetical protein